MKGSWLRLIKNLPGNEKQRSTLSQMLAKMSHDDEVCTSKFPPAKTYHEAEQGVIAKLGGLPPIWLLPTIDNDNVNQPSVMIKLAEKSKETFIEFDGRTPKKQSATS